MSLTLTASVFSSSLLGTDAVLVDVQAVRGTAGRADPPTAAEREARIRTRSALATIGSDLPGDLAFRLRGQPTTTVQLDLARALAALAAAGAAPAADGLLVLGELGLDGSVRAVRGVLAAAIAARAAGLRGVVVPAASAWEATLVEGLAVYAVADLREAVAALRGELPRGVASPRPTPVSVAVDFSDVRAMDDAARALARAVSRGGSVLLSGPPGSGKTMLARRVPTLLPAMSRDEQLGVVLAYSAVGLMTHLPAEDARPFRAPHYTISATALVGEVGHARRPGEVQLAGHGVLFLDELTEFSGATLAALAAALRQMDPRTRPRVVATATPCPCGWLGSTRRACACGAEAVERHQRRVATAASTLGIASTVEVPSLSVTELRDGAPGPSSAELRALAWGHPMMTDDLVGGEA